MRKFAVFIFTMFFSTFAFAQTTYQFDPNHTFVTWHASHFGFSNPSGKWPAEGTIVIDEKNPSNSKVDVTIQLASLITGIPKFDSHLKSPDFFDVANHPIATFKSNKVTLIGDKNATVEGILTMHGVSKPVTLNVTLNKKDISPISNKETLGFTAKTTINRSDFGISKFTPGVSDEVKIDIEAEAAKV